MRSAHITHHHIISSLGFGSELNFRSLKSGKIGIKSHRGKRDDNFMAALINHNEVDHRFSKLGNVFSFTRLEKMMILSIQNVLEESGIKLTERTGLIIATTKGNIDLLDPESTFKNAKKRVYLTELGNQIESFFNFKNKAVILSNACVSGILSLGIAQRTIQSGFYDDIVVVSGDLVSEFVLAGFMSFQAISAKPCKPYSKFRDGISIGEAVACALVTSDKNMIDDGSVQVLGASSANDANHISGPSRTGEGLYISVSSAIKEAKIDVDEVDYISAHGTATMYNDEMESIAFNRMNMSSVPLNSLKGYYGHTLGSSGLLETIIGMESLKNNILLSSIGFDEIGVSKPINIIKASKPANLNTFLKTASGFGGCNTAVIFRKDTSQ